MGKGSRGNGSAGAFIIGRARALTVCKVRVHSEGLGRSALLAGGSNSAQRRSPIAGHSHPGKDELPTLNFEHRTSHQPAYVCWTLSVERSTLDVRCLRSPRAFGEAWPFGAAPPTPARTTARRTPPARKPRQPVESCRPCHVSLTSSDDTPQGASYPRRTHPRQKPRNR